MSDFFHATPLIVSKLARDPSDLLSKHSYDVVTQEGVHLAHVYMDLGETTGHRLLRDLTNGVRNSSSYIVEDAYRRPMMRLTEQRRQRRSTTSVVWATGEEIGTVTLRRLRRPSRGYQIHDAHGRQWGEITRQDPRGERSILRRMVSPRTDQRHVATDHHGQEVALITDTARPDTSGRAESLRDHTFQPRYAQLPEPLSTLLRVATIVMHFASYAESG